MVWTFNPYAGSDRLYPNVSPCETNHEGWSCPDIYVGQPGPICSCTVWAAVVTNNHAHAHAHAVAVARDSASHSIRYKTEQGPPHVADAVADRMVRRVPRDEPEPEVAPAPCP